MIDQTANSAEGSAEEAEKCLNANTTPRPAFCIPTSIESVRLLSVENPYSLPARKPPNSPVVFNKKIAKNSVKVTFESLSLFNATINPQIKAMKVVDKAGNRLFIFLT